MTKLPTPPQMPGISWRPAVTDDAQAIISLQDACFEVDGGWREVESEVLDRWKSDQCDPDVDSLLAVDGSGTVVVSIWSHVPTIAVTKWRAFNDNYVHPDHRSSDTEEFAHAWWEARSLQRLADKQDGLPRYLSSIVYEWQQHHIGFLEAHGYQAARYFDELARDLSETIEPRPMPEGITVRLWNDAPMKDSLAVNNEAFADHWGSQPISEDRWESFFNEFHLRSASFVAYDGIQPVSYLMSAAFPQDFEDKGRKEAWVDGLGTIQSHRRRGIGSGLVTLAMKEFKQLGMEYAVLGVDSESPTGAHHVYEALGFVPDRRSISFSKRI